MLEVARAFSDPSGLNVPVMLPAFPNLMFEPVKADSLVNVATPFPPLSVIAM